MAINDNGLQYRHPHVSSVITNNDVITTTSNSNDSFFYTIVSEKGVDNVTKVMSSSEEFIKEYGEPNLAKYGQAGYNIVNLLDGGAEVYVLRVLPDDATFAHAFLNVQTKVKPNGKKIKDLNNDEVAIDDVHLRVCTAYSEGQISDEKGLEVELTNKRDTTSVDGYRDNLLLCMYPKGRGRAYNNLGFRINLNTSYDEVYDFRVYSLEILRYDEYGNSNIIEGPYQVALDPDAINMNGESMFIVDILNTYSNNMKCIFNEDVYDRIANIINPDVAPAKLDILTGQSREIMGEVETFLEPTTKKYLDTHVRLQKYSSIGDVILENGYKVLNIAAADSNINTLMAIDNELRRENYDFYYDMSVIMKQAMGLMLSDTADAYLTKLNTMFGYTAAGTPDVNTDLFKLTNQLSVLDGEILASIYDSGTQYNYSIEDGMRSNPHPLAEGSILDFTNGSNVTVYDKEMEIDRVIFNCIDTLKNILAHLKLVTDSSNTSICSQLELNITLWNKIRKQKAAIDTQVNSILHDTIFNTIGSLLADSISESTAPEEKLNNLIEVYSSLDDKYIPLLESMISSLDPRYTRYSVSVPKDPSEITDEFDSAYKVVTVKPFEDRLEELLYKDDCDYKYCKDMLGLLSNIYLPEDELKAQLDKIATKVDVLIDNIYGLIEIAHPLYRYSEDLKIMYGYPLTSANVMPLSAYLLGKVTENGIEEQSKVSTLLKTSLAIVTKEFTENMLNAGRMDTKKQQFLTRADDVINNTLNMVKNEKAQTLCNEVVLSSGISNLNKGTDGCIDEKNITVSKSQRVANIEDLIIKGYEGLIDSSILNNQLMRFKYLLDANYSDDIKRAMVKLVKDIRQDLFVWLDTQFCYSPEDAINWRLRFNIDTNFAAIYTQNGIIHDEFNGKDIKVATSYALSQKIPYCSRNYGLQYPIAGSRRGVVDCFKDNSISFYPNKLYKEQLYNRQVNYIETDGYVSKFGSQSTAASKETPLSNINNVLTILDIKRDVEAASEALIFEFNTDELASEFQQELNTSLASYVTSKACESITADVYASDYDKQQKILRVNVEIKFNDIIEKVIISLDVVK